MFIGNLLLKLNVIDNVAEIVTVVLIMMILLVCTLHVWITIECRIYVNYI